MENTMKDGEFEKIMEEIIQAIRESGFNPYAQLYGYITEGKEEFITRKGDAREKIKKLKRADIKAFVEKRNLG